MPKLPPAAAPDAGHEHPAAFEAATRARDLRAAARLATDATLGLAGLVEAVHARVASVGPGGERTRGITGLVYKSVRGVTRLVGGGVDVLLGALGPAIDGTRDAAALPSPDREALVAALNGVLGDHLARTANPLAIRMALRHAGRPLRLEPAALAAALPEAGDRLLVMIHGLCMNDLQWTRRDEAGTVRDHGATLARSLGFTPVYLHYNSGLRISANGRALADQLEQLLHAWPRPIARFAIVAHSMGGLLARSALHQGRAAGHHWPHRLDDLAFLGTPHHGAPLERAGHGVELLLGATPYAAPFARLARLRSDGIADLRHGNLLDADWAGDAAGRATDRRVPVPLPAGPRCHAIAATTGAAAGDLKDRLLGDGLVPLASALGKHRLARRTLAFPPARQHVLARTNHMELLSSIEAGEQLVRSLAG
jgi:hypothetical protein